MKLPLRHLVHFACGASLVWLAAGCGNYSTQGAGDSFVGTWSCPSTFPVGAQVLSITASQDDSLSIDGELPDGGDTVSIFCQSDLWSYAGSTVTMQAGTSCLGGATGLEVITVSDFSLTASGNKLTVNAKETLGMPADAGADAAAANKSVVTQTVTFSGTCTKQ